MWEKQLAADPLTAGGGAERKKGVGATKENGCCSHVPVKVSRVCDDLNTLHHEAQSELLHLTPST